MSEKIQFQANKLYTSKLYANKLYLYVTEVVAGTNSNFILCLEFEVGGSDALLKSDFFFKKKT